jgi:FKBP-type peptidyl-prolyl cis-trans isomerase
VARNKPKKTSKGSSGFNKKNTEDFIEKYSNKPDVKLHDSGLTYRVIEEGEGAQPTYLNTVVVHQRISLADGSVIADTYKKGGFTEEFSLEEAIEGLQLGLPLMTINSRYEFVIPPDLAWGKKGNGSKIGPNAVMIMDIRLVAIR